MKDSYFDDILKNSMETPRAIPFDESAWERMEQKMPQPATTSAWKSWMKFLPIAVGMLGLLTWNVCLQQEINYLQEHPNVVIEEKDAEQKIIYRTDTIYQITEKRITEEAIKNYLEQYVKNNGLSHTNNHFVAPNNSSLLMPNSIITSNSNSRFSGSYNPNSLKNSFTNLRLNKPFFTSNLYNPNYSNLNIRNNSDADPVALDSIKVFATYTNNDDLNEENPLNSENLITIDDNANNGINEQANEKDLAINEEISTENLINELENKPTLELEYYQNLHNLDDIDMVEISRPSTIKPTLKSKLRFEEFSAGVGNTISINLANNGSMSTVGLHLGAYILPNTSLEVELNHLNDNYSAYSIYDNGSSLYPNPFPYPTSDQIPADYNLSSVYLDVYSFQTSLGLKRIWFKDEHIRPFAEAGWLINRGFSGDVFYSYTKREGGETSFASIDYIPLESTDYLKWDFSQVYLGGGLSFSLLKGKVDLDLGVRLTQSLRSLNNISFNNSSTSAVGSFASLTYNF